MRINSFEDVVSWQKAKLLYGLLIQELESCRNYSYKDQLLRATLSISNNIAEGFDRGSDKELKQFLVIARGSAAEVRSMVIIGKDLDILQNPDAYLVLVKDISKLLTGFIKSLKI